MQKLLCFRYFLCVHIYSFTIKWHRIRYIVVFKRKLLLIFVMSALASIEVRAQYDITLSHYFDLEPTFNPAAVGKRAVLNVTAAYAIEMAGFRHNPQTMVAGVDLPFYAMKQYHGAGIQLVNDQIGLFRHQQLAGQYAFKLKLFGGTLGVGAQAGLLSETFDGSKLDLEDSSDPAFSSGELTGQTLDVGFGLYYLRGPLYVGLSGQHLLAPLVELGETNELQIDRSYYLTGGYNIRLRNPLLTIKPSFLVKTDLVGWRADVTGRLVYATDNKVMYAGVTYSPTTSVTFLVGGSFQGIVVGYSYEVYTSAINPANGSHELFIGYQTDINLVKKGRNRHQSVRIL